MWTGAGGWRWEDWELVLDEHLLSWIGPTACAWPALLAPRACFLLTHYSRNVLSPGFDFTSLPLPFLLR